MHMIFERALILFIQNYQNQSMLDETTACQSWLIFGTQCIWVYSRDSFINIQGMNRK